MPRCKSCQRRGFFLMLNELDLCDDCQIHYTREARKHIAEIDRLFELMVKSKNATTVRSLFDEIKESVEYLQGLETEKLHNFAASPQETLDKIIVTVDSFLMGFVKEKLEHAFGKSEFAATTKTKVSPLTNALLAVGKIKEQSLDSASFEEVEVKIRRSIHQTQIDGYLGAAKKHEFKNQKQKALDQYLEALYFLRTDEVDDKLQAKNISQIESKIVELGGEVPKDE